MTVTESQLWREESDTDKQPQVTMRYSWPQVISKFYRTLTILDSGEDDGLLVFVIPMSLVNLQLEAILPVSRK